MKFILCTFVLVLLSIPTLSFSKEVILTKNNTVTLRGPVNSNTVGEVMHQLNELDKKGKDTDPIYLVLQTPGGSVFDGLNLIQYMTSLRRPVHSVAIFAASMGFHILQSSEKRYITRYGTIMSHRASGGFQGDIPQQVSSRFKHITDLLEKMDEQVISRTNGKYNKKSYSELIRDEYWAVGSNAIEDAFVDEVAFVKCDESLNGTIEKKFFTFFGNVVAEFSECPLITEPSKVSGGSDSQFKDYMSNIRKLEL